MTITTALVTVVELVEADLQVGSLPRSPSTTYAGAGPLQYSAATALAKGQLPIVNAGNTERSVLNRDSRADGAEALRQPLGAVDGAMLAARAAERDRQMFEPARLVAGNRDVDHATNRVQELLDTRLVANIG